MAGLKEIDLRVMLIFGRYFARDASSKALADAAEYIAVAEGYEKERLLSEFEEGVRNNAEDQEHYWICMRLLNEAVKNLENREESA